MERTIQPEDFKEQQTSRNDLILPDVQRRVDYNADQEKSTGLEWRNPDNVDAWSSTLPQDRRLRVYCVLGGPVGSRVIDRLHERNIDARFIAGGIEAWKSANGPIFNKPAQRPGGADT
jgi:rhodanese-related sulfurtransferase